MKRNKEKLKTFNSLYYQQVSIYSNLIKKNGLTDSYYQILYIIRNNICLPYANKIVDFACVPKQTINSAIKKMESEGLIQLIKEENSKNKKIVLTEKGDKYCENTIDKIINLELKMLEKIPSEECDNYFKTVKKMNDELEREMNKHE